jgi:hypothetical protein
MPGSRRSHVTSGASSASASATAAVGRAAWEVSVLEKEWRVDFGPGRSPVRDATQIEATNGV